MSDSPSKCPGCTPKFYVSATGREGVDMFLCPASTTLNDERMQLKRCLRRHGGVWSSKMPTICKQSVSCRYMHMVCNQVKRAFFSRLKYRFGAKQERCLVLHMSRA